MPEYEIVFSNTAREGLAALDNSERLRVLKQVEKLEHKPELGDPLRGALVGFRKLYACNKRIRIIYEIEGLRLVVRVVVVGPREDAKVYRIAEVEAKRPRLRPVPSPKTGVPIELRPPS